MTEKLQDWQKRATETARNIGDATDGYVRDNTWTTIAFAAVLGCIFGYFLANRRDCLLDALREHFGKVDVSGHQRGMHVMCHLPGSLPTAATVQATALNHGVGVYSLRSAVGFDFSQTPYSTRSLVLGYPALTEEQIREGIARVARALM